MFSTSRGRKSQNASLDWILNWVILAISLELFRLLWDIVPKWGGIILARAISIEHLWPHLRDRINVRGGLDKERCNPFPWLCNWNVDPIVVVYEILVLYDVWLRGNLFLHSQSSMRVLMHLLEGSRELRVCSRRHPWAWLWICRFRRKSLHWISTGYVLIQVQLVLESTRW